MSEPKISVIIPVYNVENYLPKCLESCLRQTLYDVEFICVNDGSTDSSLAVVQQYAQLDNRFCIIDKKNGGLSSARNAGMRVARGQWIMFLDSDDYLSDDACERVWRESLEEPTDIITFGTNIFPQMPVVSSWYRSVLYTNTNRFYEFSPKVLFYTPGAKPFVWRQAFRAAFLKEADVWFDEEVLYGEDMVFQMMIFPKAQKFAFISDRLYNYRHYRKDSLMSTMKKDVSHKVAQHISMVEKITAYWSENHWVEAYGEHYLGWVLEFIVPDLRIHQFAEKADYAKRLLQCAEQNNLTAFSRKLPKQQRALYRSLKKLA